MEWSELSAWFVLHTSTWMTLACAIIVVVGFAVIGHGKKKRARR